MPDPFLHAATARRAGEKSLGAPVTVTVPVTVPVVCVAAGFDPVSPPAAAALVGTRNVANMRTALAMPSSTADEDLFRCASCRPPRGILV